MEDTIETLYSQEDILTYIGFARQFKPQLNVVSKNILIVILIIQYLFKYTFVSIVLYFFLGSFRKIGKCIYSIKTT